MQAMRFTLQIITPLYILLNAQSIIFNIINSPSGIKFDTFTQSGFHRFEGVQVAATVISNFFFISTCGAILVLGFCKKAWDAEIVGASGREFPDSFFCDCTGR